VGLVFFRVIIAIGSIWRTVGSLALDIECGRSTILFPFIDWIDQINQNFFDPHLVASSQSKTECSIDLWLASIPFVRIANMCWKCCRFSELSFIYCRVIVLKNGSAGMNSRIPCIKWISFTILEGNSIENRKKYDCWINCGFSPSLSRWIAYLRSSRIEILCRWCCRHFSIKGWNDRNVLAWMLTFLQAQFWLLTDQPP
jgi:hypothetical protein